MPTLTPSIWGISAVATLSPLFNCVTRYTPDKVIERKDLVQQRAKKEDRQETIKVAFPPTIPDRLREGGTKPVPGCSQLPHPLPDDTRQSNSGAVSKTFEKRLIFSSST